MNIFFIIAITLAAIYGFAAIGYYYAFKNWSPMCGSRKSSSATAKGIRWVTARPERGKDGTS